MRLITVILALAALAGAVAPAAGRSDDAADVRLRIARAYGLEGWNGVEVLRYTFNVHSGEREVHRSWIWRVKERTVTLRNEGGDAGGEPFTYSLDDVRDNPSEDLKKVDQHFINDQYWLLFALHLAWDTEANVVVVGEEPLPIGEGTATKVTVQYPKEGGYTPGDAYDIYVEHGDHVVQWVYRRGGRPEPSLEATWEDQRRFGPLLIPTRFRSGDGSFEVRFSGVEVKTQDGNR
jgi:hypothetical protein